MKKTDIFIMIPVSGKLCKELCENSALVENYNTILKETSEYECDRSFVDSIERKVVGKISVSYKTDDYDADKIKWMDAYGCYDYQMKSDLGILQIILPDCEEEDSQVGDIVFSDHLEIRTQDEQYSLESYLGKLGLTISGKIRIVYCNKKTKKSRKEIAYLLAGESAYSNHIDYKLRKKTIEELTRKNISKYNFYELYASQRSVVYLLDEFPEDRLEKFKKESLLLYICEVAVLQNAAIGRINKQIVNELMEQVDISARRTLKLQIEFGKSVLLWDNHIYKYYMSQKISDDIVNAFGTRQLMEEYKQNCSHIDQIAEIKNGIASEIEGRILNTLAFIVSVGEISKLAKAVIDFLIGAQKPDIEFYGVSAALLLLFLALVRWRNRLETKD